MFEKVSEIIIHGGIVQGVFASIVISTMKSRYYKLLIPLVLCFSIIIFHSFYIGSFADIYFKSPYIVAEPFIFLIGPLLFFHFRYIAYHQKFSLVDLSHLVPFLLFFLSYIPVSLHGKQTVFYGFLYNNPLAITALLWIFMAAQMMFYWHRMSVINREYKKKLRDELSQVQGFDASWINTFTILFVIIFSFVIVILVVIFHAGNIKSFGLILPLFFSLVLFFISYKGIIQKVPVLQEEEIENKGSSILIAPQKADLLKKKLTDLMQENQPFLEPELTLKDLAFQMGISRNQLSHLINNSFESNFYLFINKYRIEYLKKKMIEDKQKQFTILSLAFDSGFNSKSSFNAIFKKITGLTPSEYRNSLS